MGVHLGTVVGLYSAVDAGAPMEYRAQATLVRGQGMLGDRYAHGRGKFSHKGEVLRHITLITEKALARALKRAFEQGLEPFTGAETRRNIVVGGVTLDQLNSLVHREFRIGSVILRGVELATPCVRPGKLAQKSNFAQLFGEDGGGLRAQVCSSGVIQDGSSITIE